MNFISVCSGIEAASVAWRPLGWRAIAFSEIDPYACSLLAQRYPHVPNLGDMTNFRDWPDDFYPDVLCGGTPCQSYSNAGLRAGLDDPRGQLMLTFAAIAAKYRPKWVVWENVPGVLSSNGGRDFASLLAVLTGRAVSVPRGGWQNTGIVPGIADAYGVAWRVFDAQYAGLAQRRERVFLVGYLGDWRRAAAVLLERQSLRGDPAPSRGARQDSAGGAVPGAGVGGDGGRDVVPTLDANYGKLQGCSGQGLNHGHGHLVAGTLRATDGGADVDHAQAHHLVVFGGNNTEGPVDVATALMAHHSFRGDFESDTFLAGPAPTLLGGGRKSGGYSTDDMPIVFDETQITSPANGSNPQPGGMSGTQTGSTPDQSPSLTRGNVPALAFQERGREGGRAIEVGGDIAYALTATGGDGGSSAERNVMTPAMAVRRLMPVECERLQGFPLIINQVRIDGCTDSATSSVHAAIQCRRLQSSAFPAAAVESMQPAPIASGHSSTGQGSREPLVVLRVLRQSEDELLEVRSHGKLLWSAGSAVRPGSSRHAPLSANSVHEIAQLVRELANEVQSGRAASPHSTTLSMPAVNGVQPARTSTDAIEAGANDATSGPSVERFTTSNLGHLRPTTASTAATLFCCVARAIAGSIPSETLTGFFSFEIEVATPYTAITYNGKPAKDSPRYKGIGNSWAIPCVWWIGMRIDLVEAL